MAQLAGRRMAAEIDGDFVVFLIGARPNSKLHLFQAFRDLGGRRGMKHMLDYLVEHPEKVFSGTRWDCRRSFNTGVPSSTSRRSRRTRTIRILERGATTGGGSERALGPGSGMRRFS